MACALAATLAAAAAPAEEEPPDAALLEYLGSWEESDADWLLFDRSADPCTEEAGAEEHDAAGGDPVPPPPEDDQRCDPVPQGEASPELPDEY